MRNARDNGTTSLRNAQSSRRGSYRRFVGIAIAVGVLMWLGVHPAAADAWSCRNNATFTLMSEENQRFVTTEMNWSGSSQWILRARAFPPSTWERYVMQCRNGYQTFWNAYNHRFVSAEMAWGGDFKGILRARSSTLGPWEQFEIEDRGLGLIAIWSRAAQRYVTTEVNRDGSWKGVLRARRPGSPGAWELFRLTYE